MEILRGQRSGVRGQGVLLSGLLFLIPGMARGQSEDRQAADAVMRSMGHEHHSAVQLLHLVETAPRTATASDSTRARELIATIRTLLVKYRDVGTARKDGYEPFLPGIDQPVYHFTNWVSGFQEIFGFDPARPTSLLYRKERDGSYLLTGVMYTAPRWADEATLDQRVPLGIAPWHRHVNWCLPPRGQANRWREQQDGQPKFGPESPIATREACVEAGGRFVPQLFGWMVHVELGS